MKMLRTLIIFMVISGLLLAGPPPAEAVVVKLTPAQITSLAFASLYATVVPTALYFMWLNRPAQQTKTSWRLKGEGGFFVGAFMGASLVESTPWRFIQGDLVNSLTPPDVTASLVNYTPGVVGGLKFGYFPHSLPYVGIEVEGMFTRNDIREPAVRLSRPVAGAYHGYIPNERFYNLTLAFHFLARLGFLADKEVTFGRLQPYVGLGPGFVIIWGDVDSAKNFSLEALAGLRYMLRKHLSVFLEYKISQQWDVELQHMKVVVNTDDERRGVAHFDWTSHKIVLGIAYHFH
jgi:opacity protein-like surface antigen